jgi:glucosylceramidase
MKMKYYNIILCIVIIMIMVSCNPDSTNDANKNSNSLKIEFWLTNADKSVLFQKQDTNQTISGVSTSTPVIEVDETETRQTMDGFGFALTGGSAMLINRIGITEQDALLKELFATDDGNIGISYLRISIGASDLSDRVFSYDDLPAGQTDTAMIHFTLDPDRSDVIPILKKILMINPAIKILGSPWSAPVWMKTNNSSIGGSLKPQYYAAYAKYFVKYIRGMKKEGIPIDAITIQNEPLYGGNNPSMLMSALEQASFIKNYLGPAFTAANITTKIIVYDHNADRTDYPITVLNDTAARKYVDGSAFHLYGGTIEDVSMVHEAHPDKRLYFTEQWIGSPGNFPDDLRWHIKNLIIGAPRNWCRTVLEWNLAADQNQNPHTDGGCTECLGAVTIIGNTVVRNPAYYIVAHASKFVRPGSVRISSTIPAALPNVAFKTPDDKKVLIVLNDGNGPRVFKIHSGGKEAVTYLEAGAVGTYIW